MAAGVIYLSFSDGSIISGYCNAAPAGSFLPISEFGDAVAASAQEWKNKNDCVLTDVTNIDTNLTDGLLEVYNATTARASGYKLPLLTQANILNSVAKRPIPKIRFKGGHSYRLLVRVATS